MMDTCNNNNIFVTSQDTCNNIFVTYIQIIQLLLNVCSESLANNMIL